MKATGAETRLRENLKSAIVLGTGVNGLGVIRSLGRLGVECGAIYNDPNTEFGRYSKYVITASRVGSSAGAAEVMEALQRVEERLTRRPAVLIPTSDPFAHFLCENQEALSKDYLIRCSSADLYDSFLDKWKTATICKANNVAIPKTFCPSSREEMNGLVPDLCFPVIVKPRYTYDGTFPGKNAVFREPLALLEFFDKNDIIGKAVVQEIIPSGDGDILVTACYSGKDGRVKAIYSGRKIRQYLPDYGVTCFGISEKQPHLEELTCRFLNGIGYQGFAALEFARSRRSEEHFFLELNTRTYYHNQLFADAGMDLTKVGYLEMIGLDYKEVLGELAQVDRVLWLDFNRDLASMLRKRKEGKSSVGKWFRSIIKARSFAYWSRHDPIPFVMGCGQLLRVVFSGFGRSVAGFLGVGTRR